MGSKLPEVATDLIDFSDDPTQLSSVSNDSHSSFHLSSSSGSLSNTQEFEDASVYEQNAYSLEDYVHKPRTYSRDRCPSNEEKPPPVPPKRKIQSRRNKKLASRLLDAGFSVKDTDDNYVSEVSNQQFKGEPSPTDSTATTQKSTQSLPGAAFIKEENTKTSVCNEAMDFESRFKAVMTGTDVDLIKMNLCELELSSKPQQGLFLPEKLKVSARSSSWGDIRSQKSAINQPISTLSAEDLETFITDFGDSSLSWRKSSLAFDSTEEGNANYKIFESKTGDQNQKLERTNTLPPPRPAPPRFFNRLSLPLNIYESREEQAFKLYFGDGIFDMAEERNEEARQFCLMIADLRKLYKHTDLDTNPGIIVDSTISFRVAHYPKDLHIEVYFQDNSDPINITFNVFSKVQDVVLKALLIYQDVFKDIDSISKNRYIFKVQGESCYLEGNERLINYAYVQKCLRMGDNIGVIVMQRDVIQRDLSRNKEDDDQESMGIYFKNFFDTKSSTSISRQGLSVLIDTYNKEAEKLVDNVSKKANASYLPEQLIQVVKAVSLSLAQIESTQVHEAVNLLLSLKPSTTERILPSLQQPGVLDYNRILDKKVFDRGRFNIALEKLTSSIFSLVDAYCRAFDTDFFVQNPTIYSLGPPLRKCNTNERITSDSIDDTFSIRICSMHRIPADWKQKHEYFVVECGLYYGGLPICEQVMTSPSKPVSGFYEHIKWDNLLVLDVSIKDLPRETKVCIIVFGLVPSKKQMKDARRYSELAWLSINLFDFKGLLISGSHLFGLLSGSEMNPAATCSSNSAQNAASVILRADFQVYHTEVIFPEALVQVMQSVAYDSCSSDVRIKLDEIVSRGMHTELSRSEKELVWDHRNKLRHVPQALPYIVTSLPNFNHNTVAQVHELLQTWQPLSPVIALGLLTATFPDIVVRTHAVSWFSVVSESELCEYLPQLVQALKYETYHDSALSKFLITSAINSPKVTHYLFWHLRYYTSDSQFSQRFQIVLGGLLSTCGAAMKDQLLRQETIVRHLAEATQNVKGAKDSLRRKVLSQDLEVIATSVNGSMRLPLNPVMEVKGIVIDCCSYYNSFTVPLLIVFENSDPSSKPIRTMFKVGDDLRKDLVTLQLFRVMNRLWLSEGLDLKMITYGCLPTAPHAGMIELVPDSVTLREIHVQHGVTGSFKDDVIGLWLQKYNSSEVLYKDAVDNFSASCAAYCVATYVLGIGDRHNDNIMVTQRGHLFHIDFSKFMGNVQKFGTIRRDRVPFVLTPDMAFVINSGESMSYNFQHFVELCCDAFNIIRKNSDLILNLLGLMVSSGIPYLSTSSDIEYVRDALQLNLTDSQATVYFTRLIENSLSSKSTQWNFFIHNMAHFKDSQHLSGTARAIFSFSNKVYGRDSDGDIVSARCVDIQKRYVPDKHYIFVLNVVRKDNRGPKFVFRKYDEFQELHIKLSQLFGSSSISVLPGRVLVGRSEIRDVALKRRKELDEFIVSLMKSQEISNSEILYTFLHSFIRDEQDSVRFADILMQHETGQPRSRVGGELKLSYQFRSGCLNLLVMHARNLAPRRIQGTADPYVKSYLLPDSNKSTKRKTRVARKNLNPTYNQTLTYTMPLSELQQKVLQVTVWDNDAMGVNVYLGGVNIYPATHDLTQEVTRWYELKELGLGM